MSKKEENERLVRQKVTYILYKDGRFYIVENVPARVDVETGEQFFSPEAVEALQRIISGQKKPARTVQTPVFYYTSVYHNNPFVGRLKNEPVVL